MRAHHRLGLLALPLWIGLIGGPDASAQPVRPRMRLVVSTDFPPLDVILPSKARPDDPPERRSDPDDIQSMVRFLLYSNEFDVEALIATSATFAGKANKQDLLDLISLYAQVYSNLKQWDRRYPTPEYLRSVTFQGRDGTWGRAGTANIGEGKGSEASEALIRIVDRPDPRPVYLAVWGDCSFIAQAIWEVRKSRTPSQLETFLGKLRVHQVATQDGTIGWLRETFPKLFIIHSQKTYLGMFGGRDPVADLRWVNEHIRSRHGPLCAAYPPEGVGCTGVCEGDSPSFLWLVSACRGLNDPDDPTQPSWGGQFVRDGEKSHYLDGPGATSIARWRKDFQDEFRDRAGWCVEPPPGATPDHTPGPAAGTLSPRHAAARPRIINMTDLGADPDDEQSLVRLLACANEFDIEGLIATTSCWRQSQPDRRLLDKIVTAYGSAEPNLRVHADGYPSVDHLRSVSMMGQPGYGMTSVGEGKDSPGSDLIIAAVDRDDPRPVWVACWGGANTVAQAIWKVRASRSVPELSRFLSRLRVFDVLGQDDAGAWIASQFPTLMYIRATGVYGWAPSDDYLRQHIQSHGPLGAVYPNRKYATEGDTPAFLHVYPTGLNDPDKIDQGGWGGRFGLARQTGIRGMSEVKTEARFDPYTMYGNTPEGARAILRWSTGYNNDFEARMDWSTTHRYADANHHPVAAVNGDRSRRVLEVAAAAGSSLTLSAAGSSDPDGDRLSCSWAVDTAPSAYKGRVTIENSSTELATVAIPADSAGQPIHVLLVLHDAGAPNLYAYRRIIVTPTR